MSPHTFTIQEEWPFVAAFFFSLLTKYFGELTIPFVPLLKGSKNPTALIDWVVPDHSKLYLNLHSNEMGFMHTNGEEPPTVGWERLGGWPPFPRWCWSEGGSFYLSQSPNQGKERQCWKTSIAATKMSCCSPGDPKTPRTPWKPLLKRSKPDHSAIIRCSVPTKSSLKIKESMPLFATYCGCRPTDTTPDRWWSSSVSVVAQDVPS